MHVVVCRQELPWSLRCGLCSRACICTCTSGPHGSCHKQISVGSRKMPSLTWCSMQNMQNICDCLWFSMSATACDLAILLASSKACMIDIVQKPEPDEALQEAPVSWLITAALLLELQYVNVFFFYVTHTCICCATAWPSSSAVQRYQSYARWDTYSKTKVCQLGISGWRSSCIERKKPQEHCHSCMCALLTF